MDLVLSPDVGFLVGVEGGLGAVDGDVAAEGELGVADGHGGHCAEEGDVAQGFVAAKGVAADGGDVGRDEVAGDCGTVEEAPLGDLGETMGDDEVAHVGAVEEGKGSQLHYGMGHDDIDQRDAVLEGVFANGGEGLGHLDDAQIGAGVEGMVADGKEGGGQFDSLDADAVGKGTVADSGDDVGLAVVLDGTGHLDVAAKHLGVLEVGPYADFAVVDDFVVQHLACGTYGGEVGLFLGLYIGCCEPHNGN